MKLNISIINNRSFLKIILPLIFIFLSIGLTFVFYKKLVPQLDSSIRRENPHRVIARQNPFVIEVTGGNISPNSDDISQLNSQISDVLKEFDTINSFPFIAKWFLKFNIDVILKNVSIKNSDIQVTPEVLCNNVISPQLIILSERKTTLQEFYSELTTSFPSLLNGCTVSVTSNNESLLPDNYIAIESYGFKIEPVIINYFIILIVVILGLFATLPIIKEGVKFFSNSFDYFNKKSSDRDGSKTPRQMC